MKKTILAFAVLSIATIVQAGEGMWMPQQVPQLSEQLTKMGLQIDPKSFADLTGHPMGAIVNIPGCSASFVSSDGLVITNHHCAYGGLQYNSTPQRDLITEGFLAKTREEELSAGPGSRVFVTTAIEDVTPRVTGNIPAKATDLQRYKTIDQRRKQIVEECEKPGGVRCSVSSFFEGAQYLKITQMEIRDVRLVYSPALGIGNFGGETDNWMWPRHTGDWSFIRAYVGKDGKPADYSKDNVPYHPQQVLKVSTAGINEGDLVIVAGYPGRTYRYETAAEVESDQSFYVPTVIRYAKDLNAILEEQSKKSKQVEILNANRIKGNANLLKNYEGTAEVFATGKILAQRKEREAALASYLSKNADMQKKYGTAVSDVEKLGQQLRSTRDRDLVLTWILRSSPMLTQANSLYRLSIEKTKKDLERASGYQQRDLTRIGEAVDRAQKTIEPASDRAGLRYFLLEATKLPATQRIKAVDDLLAATGATGSEAQIDKFLDSLYASTKLTALDVRHQMMNETTAQLKARKDSFVDFAAALTPLLLERENRDQTVSGAMSRVRPLYLEALRAMSGGTLYPDANSTLRVTFGKVEGYVPRDAVYYNPQTTVAGVVKKDRGEGEFNSPKALLAAAKNPELKAPYIDPQLNDVPVDFLSSCDTTGGNSGSATLNAKGELCGLLFDGNYEALGSDYLVEPALTRSIHVDITYVLWVMDAVDHAHNLLREMNVPVHFQ